MKLNDDLEHKLEELRSLQTAVVVSQSQEESMMVDQMSSAGMSEAERKCSPSYKELEQA